MTTTQPVPAAADQLHPKPPARTAMKFGVLQFFSWSRRIPLEQVYERAFQRIAIMDEGGYDTVWLAEHHFNTYSVCPSVTLMGTHIAARTRRLRIGMAVTLAAFYHPLRLAEELALLDILSGGRLDWGAGRGFDPTEMRAFGVPVDESSDRFREAVEIVLQAWGEGRVTHHGRFWDFESIEVLPKPLQQPHPPVWLAATSPESIKRAAEKGYSILQDPHASHAEIGKKRELYRQCLAAAGYSYEGREIPTARLIAIADTDAEAREVARAGAQWTVTSYAHGKVGGIQNAGVDRPEGIDPVERYLNDVVIYGSPSRVIDKVTELRETIGLEYLMCSPLSHESFVQFTEHVLPRWK
jgi:alkanesulfonate monooxygenase SsuD/methylene tetrahydromethanopterin reductase-like flavin-dependent oxidoreductase (luciferase family)